MLNALLSMVIVSVVLPAAATAADYAPATKIAPNYVDGNTFLSAGEMFRTGYVLGIVDSISAIDINGGTKRFSELSSLRLRDIITNELIAKFTAVLARHDLSDPMERRQAVLELKTYEQDRDLAILLTVQRYLARGISFEDASIAFSVPSNVTAGQYRQIAEKFMQENPEQTHLSAAALVWEAIGKAFHADEK